MIKDPHEIVGQSFVPTQRFRGPIDYAPIDKFAPTPLDSEAAEYNKVPVIRFIGMELHRRAEQAASLHGLSPELSGAVEYELMFTHERRSSKNRASFDRLLRQVEDKELDDAMVQIIEKARQSAADPQELLRLIKEYPDMISLEFFKCHSMLDVEQYKEINDRLGVVLETLRSSFQDAEVTLYDGEERMKSRVFAFGTGSGAGIYVSRERVAEVRSVDSRVEALVKSSFLVLPKDFTDPYASILAVIQGEERRLLPLATIAYFRTVNYRERLEEISGKVEKLGTRVVNDDPILNMIPPGMRDAYLQAFGVMPPENDDA